MEVCPCGSGNSYSACCGRFILNQQKPSTAEELMRSRYTAYTRADIDYIARTMKSPASDHFNAEEAGDWARQANWLGLEVLCSGQEGATAFVEFRAHYSYQGQKHCIHERSVFCLEQGQWFYFDGKVAAAESCPQKSQKISRNASCPCGSGKKYKKCCSA